MKNFYKAFSVGEKIIEVKAYKGVRCVKWNEERYRHRIVLKVGEKEESFSFYGSMIDYLKRNAWLKDIDIAVLAIFEDAFAYMEHRTQDDFFSAFGYDEDTLKDGVEAFRGCREIFFKLRDLNITDDEILELTNTLNK